MPHAPVAATEREIVPAAAPDTKTSDVVPTDVTESPTVPLAVPTNGVTALLAKDKLIVRDMMRMEGFTDAEIDARMDAVLARYLEHLRVALADPARRAQLLPGVGPLIDAVEAADDLVLGLLTGNVVEGARAKLAAVDLAFDRFALGAYGSDHEDRSQLPPVALARAQALLGRALAGDRLVIIGDTPADVHCGRGVGARAIAVATGGYSVEELDSHAPAATFADLRDTARVLEAIRDA